MVPTPLAVTPAAVVAPDNDHDDDEFAAEYHTLLFGAGPPAVHVCTVYLLRPFLLSRMLFALRLLPASLSELDSDDDSLADIPTLIGDDSDSDDELDQHPDTVASRLAPGTFRPQPISSQTSLRVPT